MVHSSQGKTLVALVIYVTADDLHTLVMLLQPIRQPLLLPACGWKSLLFCKHLSLFSARLRGVIASPLCMKSHSFIFGVREHGGRRHLLG